MKKITLFKKLWAVMLLSMIFGLVANAAVIPVPNTVNDTLENLIEKHGGTLWQPGDTIMLTDADLYTVTGTIDIYHEITIMGDPDLASKPTLFFDDNGFRPKEDSISVTLKGFKAIGWVEVDSSSRAVYLLRFDQAGFKNYNNVLVEDIEAWGFQGGIQLYKNKGSIYKSVKVNNVIFHDMTNQNAIELGQNIINELIVTNSTFYNIQKGILGEFYADSLGYPKDVTIENNTFYNVIDGGALFAVQNLKDDVLNLSFKNNICHTLFSEANARPFRVNDTCGVINMSNNIFYNFESNRTNAGYDYDSLVQSNFSNITLLDNLTSSPSFTDEEEYDFTFKLNSPAAKASADGGPIGDPSWQPNVPIFVPGERVHSLGNDIDIEAFIEDTSRWEAGDTILLITDGGEYKITGTVDLYQEITVMGSPLLNVPPTLLFEDNGFRPKEDSISVTLKGFNAIGWERTDSSSRAAYLLRYDQAGWKNYNNVVVEDIEAWGFQGGIQLYKNKGSIYKSVKVDNVIFHDMTNQNAIELGQNIINEVIVTNSTFYNIQKGILGEFYADSLGYPKDVTIENNTFYKIIDGGALFAVQNLKDDVLNLSFKNNICHTLFSEANARPFRVNDTCGTINLSNNVFYSFDSKRTSAGYDYDSLVLEAFANITLSGNLNNTDAEFTDADAANFTLPETSALITGGTDGGPIGDPDWVPVIGVEITKVGDQVVDIPVTLEATVTLSGEVDKTVAWSVNNGTGTATIDAASGELTPATAGTVTVIATSNYNTALKDSLVITIRDQYLITGFDLKFVDIINEADIPNNTINKREQTIKLVVTVTPANADNKDYSVSSGNTDIAAVSGNYVSSVDNGEVYIIVTASDKGEYKDSIKLTITNQRPVTGITIAGKDGVDTVQVDKTLQMVATLTPAEPDDPTVTWSVTNGTGEATIDEATGVLTGVKAGKVTVKGKASSLLTNTVEITVTAKPSETAISNVSLASVSIMPNPASEMIWIKANQTTEVIITNVIGKVVLTKTVEANSSLDIQNLKPGLYLVNIKAGEQVATVKLQKK